jgi:hypothetical protein
MDLNTTIGLVVTFYRFVPVMGTGQWMALLAICVLVSIGCHVRAPQTAGSSPALAICSALCLFAAFGIVGFVSLSA